jgi:hypothetical protein
VAAFRLRDLAVLAYAQGFTLWHYRAPPKIDDIMTKNYFADAAGLFAAGDRVMVTGPSGSRDLLIAATGPAGVVVAPCRSPPDRRRGPLNQSGSP